MKPSRKPPLLAAVLAIVFVLLATQGVDRLNRAEAERDARLHLAERLSSVRLQLEARLQHAYAGSRALALVYATQPERVDEYFDAMAHLALKDQQALRNYSLLRDSRISRIYPQEGNRGALGRDVRSVTEQWPAYLGMMQSHEVVTAGPYELMQKGTALILRVPVFQAYRDAAFLGSVSAVISLQPLLLSAGLTNLEEHYAVALRGRDGTGESGSVFYGDTTLSVQDALSEYIAVPGGSWQLIARPRAGWNTAYPLETPLWIIGVVLALLAGTVSHTIVSNQQQRRVLERELHANQDRLMQRDKSISHQNTVLNMIVHHAELGDVLYTLACLAESHLPGTRCAIMLANADGTELHLATAPTLDQASRTALQRIDAAGTRGACNLAVAEGELVYRDDVESCAHSVELAGALHRAGLSGCWAQPIYNIDGKLLGTFACYLAQPRTPEYEDVAMMESYATLTAVAIERSENLGMMKVQDAALNATSSAIIITDANARILWSNEAFARLTGYTVKEATSRHCGELIKSGEHDRAFYQDLWDTILSGRHWHGEMTNRRKDGSLYRDETEITPVMNRQGQVTHFIAVKRDVSERLQKETQLRNLAFYDALTNLPNRRLLLDRLEHALMVSKRSQHYGALMFLDLDNFKPLNDQYGHDVGDQLLQVVAQRITACVRAEDTVARFGGDEFVVMLGELSEERTAAASQASIVAEKILAALGAPYPLELMQPEQGYSTIEHRCSSIGIALFREGETTRDEVMRNADSAMYQAKAAGRNTLRFSTE